MWPALGATGALLILLLGYRMMRGQPSEYLDAADLILLKEERRREAAAGSPRWSGWPGGSCPGSAGRSARAGWRTCSG